MDSAVRHPVLAVALAFAVSLTVYLSNGETISSYDAVPSSLLAYDALGAHRLDFDTLRGGYFAGLGGQYAFVEAPDGHLAPVFPIGTALVTAPVFAALYAVHALRREPVAIASPAFEPVRRTDEKLAAAIVAAAAVALFWATARSFAAPFPALLATIGFAFGTETWMIGSQGLWQHGSVELVLLGLIFALVRADRAAQPRAQRRWLFVAGICIGLLPVVRPTAAVFALAGLAFAAWWFGRRAAPAAAGAALGIAPGVGWNAAVFHSLLGGYTANAHAYTSSFAAATSALAALAVSPSRGLFVYTPLVIVSGLGLWRAARLRTVEARLLTTLAVATLALYASYGWFAGWIGGDTYGPRFLTDGMPVVMLLAAYVVPASAAAAAAYAAVLVWSVGVQAVGAFSGAAGPLWNEIPLGLAYAPQRVWQLSDSQIERNLRATYYHYAPDYPTGGARYLEAFDGRVLAVTRADGTAVAARRGETLALAASLRNTGGVPWFGFASAVYNREARVRTRISGGDGRVVAEGELYVEGNVAPGATGRAIGTLPAPGAAGTYSLQCEVIAQGAAVRERPAHVENFEVVP